MEFTVVSDSMWLLEVPSMYLVVPSAIGRSLHTRISMVLHFIIAVEHRKRSSLVVCPRMVEEEADGLALRRGRG